MNEREALRLALLDFVADIEPRADGLQRIHHRLRPPRPLAVTWAEGAWTYLRMRVPDALQAFLELLLAGTAVTWERFGPRSGTWSGRRSRTIGWLRPATVLGVTVFIVALGTYVALSAGRSSPPSASNLLQSNGHNGGTGGGSQGNASGTNAQSHSALGGAGGAPGNVKPTCRPSKPAVRSSSTASAGQTASPSASPSDSSGGASPSPAVTDTSSPNPDASATSSTSPPPLASLASPAANTRAPTRTSRLPLCAGKHRSAHPASTAPTPNPSTAVTSYSKFDDGS